MAKTKIKESEIKKGKGNGVVMIAGAICLAIVLAVVLFLVFGAAWGGWMRLGSFRGNIEDAIGNTQTVVIVSDPNHNRVTTGGVSDILSKTASFSLQGVAADAFIERVLKITDSVDFDSRGDATGGNWDIAFSVRDGEDFYILYLCEDGRVYVSDNGYKWYFTVEESVAEEYKNLYEDIESRF